MRLMIVNDMHGSKLLINNIVDAIEATLQEGDTIVINGDGAGSRGEIMNAIVNAYYRYRGGTMDENKLRTEIGKAIGCDQETLSSIPLDYITKTDHAGVFRHLMAKKYPAFLKVMRSEIDESIHATIDPIARAANGRGVSVYYVPGNGEVIPENLIVDGYNAVGVVDYAEQYYAKLDKDGYFSERKVNYVPFYRLLRGNILLIGINLLDLSTSEVDNCLSDIYTTQISTIITHYPPDGSILDKSDLSFWKPSSFDGPRMRTLKYIVSKLSVERGATFYFGHVHKDVVDPSIMSAFPPSESFCVEDINYVWVNPYFHLTFSI